MRRFAEDSLKVSGGEPERSFTNDECRKLVSFWCVEYERGLCVANHDIAKALQKLKKYDEALSHLHEAIDLREDLGKRQTGDFLTGNEILELVSVYSLVASIYVLKSTEDSLTLAHKYYSRALQFSEELLKMDQTPAVLLSICSAKMGIAQIYFNRQGIHKSLELTLEYLPLLEQINMQEKNAASKQNLATAYRSIGLLYEKLVGDVNLQKASAFYNRSRNLAEDAAARMPSNDTVRFMIQTEIDVIDSGISFENDSCRDKLSSLGGKYNILLKLFDEIPSESMCTDIEHVINIAVKFINDYEEIDEHTRTRACIELKALLLSARLKTNPDADTLRELNLRFAGLADELMNLAGTKTDGHKNILCLLEDFNLPENDLTAADSERAYNFIGHVVKLSQELAEDSDEVKDYDFLAVSLAKYCPLCFMHVSQEEVESVNCNLTYIASKLYKQTGRKKYIDLLAVAQVLKSL